MRRAAGLALAAVLVLAGCGGSTDLAPDRAHTLQQTVLAVTQAAAESRWDDALAQLDEARTELDAGVDAGEVSTARYREVDAALDRVTAEITAEKERVAAAQAAEQAAATPTATTPAPAPEPPAKGKDKDKDKNKNGK
ncbi:mucin-associated surface protein [Cellulomonas sp. ICMP 17802]|uniref:mucin-associated surface protein n=1 Tax=Cellulomonas sp. ICMP 17802 TaxID=3239199 RepID=UPI00351BDEAB